MRNVLIVLVAIASVAANLPYIRDVLKGKSKPNIATWSTWTLLNVIVITSAIAAGGAINTVVMGIAFLFGSASILIISLFKGTRRYTWFDGVCQAIAILGVVLWQLSNNPNVALLFVIIVDTFAILPTLRHAYFYPYEETWITYLLEGMAAAALTALASSYSFASLAITTESSLIGLTITLMILYRRSKQPTKSTGS